MKSQAEILERINNIRIEKVKHFNEPTIII